VRDAPREELSTQFIDAPTRALEQEPTIMNALARTWSIWIVRGFASVIFGVLTILQPGASIAAIVLVYGLYALVDGALLLGFAFRHEGQKAPYVIRGLISIAAGLVAFLLPGPTALAFYVLIGAWAVTAGAAELAIAIAIRKDGFRVSGLVVAGLLSLACGVALLVLPVAGVVALISVIAAYAIINGVALVVAGVRIRRLTKPMAAA
jgi:uncharacterized membrane protein HdeD (DUF308 family)